MDVGGCNMAPLTDLIVLFWVMGRTHCTTTDYVHPTTITLRGGVALRV